MQIRLLTRDDVRAAVGMKDAIAAMGEAFAQLSTGRADVPLRHQLRTRGGITLLMPAYLRDTADLGLKVVSVNEGNAARGLPVVNAVVLVLDPDTGLPLALMDGTWLTALRTGAASGLATRLLAREDATIVALFGAGVQARTQLEAVRAVRPIREVRIVSRTAAAARRLAAELDGVTPRVMDDAAEAVRGAHIVITATTSTAPVFPGAALEPGTHVNAIGAYTPEMRELDDDAVRSAVLIVDSREAALSEPGDIVIPIRSGAITPSHIRAELGEVAAGTRPGRTSADEITVFKSVGSAVQDVVVARLVLRAAESRGLGTLVEL